MANKSRPKKTRGIFYKKYVYGVTGDVYEDSNGDLWIKGDDNIDHIVDNSIKNTKPNKDNSIDKTAGLRLPLEIIIEILKLTSNPYCTNHLVLCRAIYWMFLKNIYEYPELKSKNLESFLDVISGDDAAMVKEIDDDLIINKDKKKVNSKLALKRKFQLMVKCLDLSSVVQNGKNSYMSKLLRRTSNSLEIFISSQSAFGAAPLVSLRACNELKILDLRLVSESVNLVELFKSIESLPQLEQLCFPRSSLICDEYEFKWPEKLWYLRLQGGITDSFAINVRLPQTITTLEFAHCPNLTDEGLNYILSNIGINLNRLSIQYPMPKIGEKGADKSFYLCPNLKYFFIDIGYISWELLNEENLVFLEEFDRPLKSIIIESTGYMGMCEKLTPNDITVAVDEGRLPCLEKLGLSAMLGWDFKSNDMEDMVSELFHHDIQVFKI